MTEPTGIAEDRARLRQVVAGIIADRLAAGVATKDIRAEISTTFPDLPPATIYRWIDGVTKSGAIGQRLIARKMKGGRRAATDETLTVTALPLAAYMGEAILAIQATLRHAQGEDPNKPRNPRMTLTAAVALTRAMQTALALHQALTAAQRVDEFHAAMIEEIARESPEVAQRVTNRLRALTSRLEV